MEPSKVKEIDREIAKLIGKRENRFLRVQRLYELSKNLNDPKNLRDFEALMGNLDATVREFQGIMDRINELNLLKDDKYTVDYNALDAFEDLVCFVRQAARLQPSPSCPRNSSDSVPLAQLPKIDLPEFSGDPLKWPVFYDTFHSLIHENPNLDPIAKVYYLMGCLKGRALDVCSGIPPSAANYPILWNLLVAKFQKLRLLAGSYHQQMLEYRTPAVETAESLEAIADRFSSAFRALERLSLSNLGNFFATSLLLWKLPPGTRQNFEMSDHSEIPTFDEVTKFLYNRADAIRQFKPHSNSRFWSAGPSRSPQVMVANAPHSPKDARGSRPCALCRGDHLIYLCTQFVKASVADRWALVKKKALCLNCLSDIHHLQNCQSRTRCRFCSKPHHSMLHPRSRSCSLEEVAAETSKSESDNENPSVHNLCATRASPLRPKTFSVLPTVMIHIVTQAGIFPARFLIDSGSQVHLISLKCCRRAKLPVRKGTSSLGCVGGVSQTSRGQTQFVISSRTAVNVSFEINALVLPRITNPMPVTQISTAQREACQSYPLADLNFDQPGDVDGILGVQVFAQILESSKPIQLPFGLSLLPTKLGHVVMGVARSCSDSWPMHTDQLTSLCTLEEPTLHQLLRKFWELEEVEAVQDAVLGDECELHFAATFTRTKEGRYCVSLPFSEFPPVLGDSLGIAKRRFYTLERQLAKSPELKSKYVEGMNDYIAQNHVSEVQNFSESDSHFIPHFAVFKSSSSTPVRIVFDASCKSSNGKSLNDVLLTGPKLQANIQEILTRFRMHPIAVAADIRQMYRNILVVPSQRRYQRFLWRSNPTDPLRVFELNCVPFGLAPAPFLALRTVKQLAQDERSNFPLAARIVENDMYVDDVVTSVPEAEAVELYDQLTRLFRAGGFSLVKWVTNSLVVAQAIPDQDQIVPTKALEEISSSELPAVKVLGLNWNAVKDSWFFSVNPKPCSGTKREIMSTLARIWDPLGFLSPVTLTCKVLIKKLWLSKCGWDDQPPSAILKMWLKFSSELSLLSELKIPRFPGDTHRRAAILAGFADSSEAGYGAVIYTVVPTEPGELQSTILIAKSKVTPMRPCSIPRLELCAAVLLSKLYKLVLSTFSHIAVNQIHAFSDSEDVLYWLSKEPTHWKAFVANRVSKIQSIVPSERWFHVPSKENAADSISRGLLPSQLMQLSTWTTGPRWLLQPAPSWPCRKVSTPKTPILESKLCTAMVIQNLEGQPIRDLILRSSSYRKLCSVLVIILRFTKRLPVRPVILNSDLEVAERYLIRMVQEEHFADEFARLIQKKPPSQRLAHLNPFIEDGCIRVGGRLANAPISYSRKFPFLLAKDCRLVSLIVDHYHVLYLHAGPNLLLSLLRQKFWILSARRVIRKRIHQCIKCFRFNPTNAAPIMAPLPPPRVSEVKPFVTCGVDYAGPFRVTVVRSRGAKSQKAYICLFICLTTKAVHLELASDVSTPAFLRCYTRFFSRRGPVSIIYSDCGTNFVGAKRQLKAGHQLIRTKEFQAALNHTLRENQIEWRFNPPSAPHFGGIWEANIKSVKTHLFRVIGDQILSLDEFNTLLVQIEALLNSRPLCVLSSDPSEPEALTPAHFLSLTPLRALPVPSPDSDHTPLSSRKELLDVMVKHFWKRWHLEYLSSLHPRKKWTSVRDSLSEGVVVLVREENCPPLQWPLGMIEKVYPGADGVVRVADVRVRGSILKRPVVKLFPLPNQ